MKKIDIKRPGKIGVVNINKDEVKENLQETEKVKLRIGVFFDGTGNNKDNSDQIYYNKKYNNPPLEEDKISNIKDFKSFVIESGSSYWNSYSNIALLHDLYEEKQIDKSDENPFYYLQKKYYIEGIGTLKDNDDDIRGSGFGEGPRGVISRVEQACQVIAKGIAETLEILKKNKKKPLKIISIQFDVFGFSRGAAAARHFCNEVLKTGPDKDLGIGGDIPITGLKRPNIKEYVKTKDHLPSIKEEKANGTKKLKDNTRVVPQFNAPPARNVFIGGVLGESFNDYKINYPKYNISIEFLGIFDTVISQMLERKGIIDIARKPFAQLSTQLSPILGMLTDSVALIKKVNPNLSNPYIKKILHIKAQTEWRDNFPITPVGDLLSPTYAKEITVLGSHSDIGGGYWQAKEELNTLHFFDIEPNPDIAEKQNMEKQKELIRKWYISQKLCSETQINWKIMHHVQAFKTYSNSSLDNSMIPPSYLLMDENFMGQDTVKTENNTIYTLVGYHHKLVSSRPLNNKLSLVYMNVMKYIALNYANVPFTISESKTKHREEYIYPESYIISEDKKYELEGDVNTLPKKDLEKYQNLIIKAAEDGWINKEGRIVTYPDLVDKDGYFSISPEMYNYIMGKFVHLSANFTSPLAEILNHYNFAYANAPHFTDEKDFKDPPYKREYYMPILAKYDIS